MDKSLYNLPNEEPWRIFRIMSEFVEAFEILSKIGKAVSVFGSARIRPNSPYYKKAVATSTLLVQQKFAVITGGGPGIMEAANRGAKKGGGISVGLNIDLPTEQRPNLYQTHPIRFHYFFCRKVCFVKYASAFVLFPGGLATLEAFIEALTSVQAERIERFPIILVGRRRWEGLASWNQDTLFESRLISKSDTNLFKIVEEPEEIVQHIQRFFLTNNDNEDGD